MPQGQQVLGGLPRAGSVVEAEVIVVEPLRRLADKYCPLVAYYSLRPFDPNLPRAEDWLREQGR